MPDDDAWLRELTEGSKRELLRKLVETGSDPTSRHFETVRTAIQVRIAEDNEAALKQAARAGRGLTVVVAVATVIGTAAAVVAAFH